MTDLIERVLGDDAADTVALTGIPVLLLAEQPGPATITTSHGGKPSRYTATIVTYSDGLRGEVHAPGGPGPDDLARGALPGGGRVSTGYMGTPERLTPCTEIRHDGLLARACSWHGWTLLTVTVERQSSGRLLALRLVGADSLREGRPGMRVAPSPTERAST
ncbi:hypothetical protein [Kitasatospora cineracea]|uniref:hypothetical protein n=1 Tax=Kitasatospora cineracea TaxID=88074 RepID=UPI0033F26760